MPVSGIKHLIGFDLSNLLQLASPLLFLHESLDSVLHDSNLLTRVFHRKMLIQHNDAVMMNPSCPWT